MLIVNFVEIIFLNEDICGVFVWLLLICCLFWRLWCVCNYNNCWKLLWGWCEEYDLYWSWLILVVRICIFGRCWCNLLVWCVWCFVWVGLIVWSRCCCWFVCLIFIVCCLWFLLCLLFYFDVCCILKNLFFLIDICRMLKFCGDFDWE